MDDIVLSETEEEMVSRLTRAGLDPSMLEWERRNWKSVQMKYQQTERMIAAIEKLAEAIASHG